jgi:type IV pilus assembly protein PilQ
MKALLSTLFCLAHQDIAKAANISNLEFKFSSPASTVEIQLDEDTEFKKSVSEADNQVIIDLKNTQVPESLARKTDTSQFKSNVSLLSAYQRGSDARVVLQLKGRGDVSVSKNGTTIVAQIDNDATGAESSDTTAEGAGDLAADATAGNEATDDSNSETSTTPGEPTMIRSESSTSAESSDLDSIESFMDSQSTKKYVGTRISIQMNDADLKDIFRIIANASEFNILLAENVRGRMTLDLTDVPWDQVLDIVLKANRLSAERVANILRVLPAEDLQREKEAETQARIAAETSEPLVTKIFPISYASPEDVRRILGAYLSRDPRTNAVRGSIDVDRRSNSLVVRETPTTVEKFKRIIRELDTQTPQILIEGKFVEVSENFTKEFAGHIYATSRENRAGAFDFHPTNNNYGFIFGTGPLGGSATSALALSPAAGGASLGFAPKAGLLPGLPDLAAILSLSQTQRYAKVISSPRVVTQNRNSATITQGTSLLFASLGGVGAAGGFQTVNATLNLTVEPQVTNEGSINLRINFSESTPLVGANSGNGGPAFSASTKSLDTLVLVDSGATVVIGGVYSSNQQVVETGIPFLRDIPILGALFGGKNTTTAKTELFIFITPRILNEKEAGLRT